MRARKRPRPIVINISDDKAHQTLEILRGFLSLLLKPSAEIGKVGGMNAVSLPESPPAVAVVVAVDEVLARWRDEMTGRGLARSSINRFIGIINRVSRWAGWSTTADIKAENAEAFMAAGKRGELAKRGQAKKWGGSTYNQVVSTLRLFGAFLERKGLLPKNPFAGLLTARKPEARRRRALEVIEAQRLIAATLNRQNRDKRAHGAPALFYAVAMTTGLRYAELCSLDWRAVALGERPCIRTDPMWEGNKAKRSDYIALPRWVAALLRCHRLNVAHRSTDRVFPIVPNRRTWRMDLDAAGIAEVDDRGRVTNFHCCRATYATLLDALGLSAGTVAAMVRHATTLTESRYIDTREKEMFEAAQRLPMLWPDKDLPPDDGPLNDPEPPDFQEKTLALEPDARYLASATNGKDDQIQQQSAFCGGSEGRTIVADRSSPDTGLPQCADALWGADSGRVTSKSSTVSPITEPNGSATVLENRAIALVISWMETRLSRPPHKGAADEQRESDTKTS